MSAGIIIQEAMLLSSSTKTIVIVITLIIYIEHEMALNSKLTTPYIHVDVYPAMTGITRFMYENEDLNWRYNRTEHLTDE
jgi:hypothetical protein